MGKINSSFLVDICNDKIIILFPNLSKEASKCLGIRLFTSPIIPKPFSMCLCLCCYLLFLYFIFILSLSPSLSLPPSLSLELLSYTSTPQCISCGAIVKLLLVILNTTNYTNDLTFATLESICSFIRNNIAGDIIYRGIFNIFSVNNIFNIFSVNNIFNIFYR